MFVIGERALCCFGDVYFDYYFLEVFMSSFDRVMVTPFDYLNSISGERVRDNQHLTDNVVIYQRGLTVNETSRIAGTTGYRWMRGLASSLVVLCFDRVDSYDDGKLQYPHSWIRNSIEERKYGFFTDVDASKGTFSFVLTKRHDTLIPMIVNFVQFYMSLAYDSLDEDLQKLRGKIIPILPYVGNPSELEVNIKSYYRTFEFFNERGFKDFKLPDDVQEVLSSYRGVSLLPLWYYLDKQLRKREYEDMYNGTSLPMVVEQSKKLIDGSWDCEWKSTPNGNSSLIIPR